MSLFAGKFHICLCPEVSSHEEDAMRNHTRMNESWRRKATIAGMLPMLFVQGLIVIFWVPQTLEGRSETRLATRWEGLPYLLDGDSAVTIILTGGGAVRSDSVTFLDNSIHIHRITMATDSKRYPWGSEASIARGSVKEIHVERLVGRARKQGLILGIAGGSMLPVAFGIRGWGEWSGTAAAGRIAVLVAAPVGGGILGHWLGKRLDRQATIITIVD